MFKLVSMIMPLIVFLHTNPLLAAYQCGEAAAVCEVSYSDTADETAGFYAMWIDCELDGELVSTTDGEVSHIPSEEELHTICVGGLKAFIDTVSLSVECSDGDTKCTVEFAGSSFEDEENMTFPMWGDCSANNESSAETWDGEIDHVPTKDQLDTICENELDSYDPQERSDCSMSPHSEKKGTLLLYLFDLFF